MTKVRWGTEGWKIVLMVSKNSGSTWEEFEVKSCTAPCVQPAVDVDSFPEFDKVCVAWMDQTPGILDIFARCATVKDGEKAQVEWQSDPVNVSNSALSGSGQISLGGNWDGNMDLALNSHERCLTDGHPLAIAPGIVRIGDNVYIVNDDTTNNPENADVNMAVSRDGGQSWTGTNSIATDGAFPDISTDGTNLYVVFNSIPFGDSDAVGFICSTDGGATWKRDDIPDSAPNTLGIRLATGVNIYLR